MTDAEVQVLVEWLNTKRPNLAPYSYKRLNKFYRIVGGQGGQASVHCFIAEYDLTNKALGEVKSGDIFKPASWSTPAKHKRGELYAPSTWDKCFGEWGVNYLR